MIHGEQTSASGLVQCIDGSYKSALGEATMLKILIIGDYGVGKNLSKPVNNLWNSFYFQARLQSYEDTRKVDKRLVFQYLHQEWFFLQDDFHPTTKQLSAQSFHLNDVFGMVINIWIFNYGTRFTAFRGD